MKLLTLSDLHLYLHGDLSSFGDKLVIPEADICVLAGDITDSIISTFEWVSRVIRPHMSVIMVLGNHEFLGAESYYGGLEEAKLLAEEFDIQFLENRAITCSGRGEQVRFIGATLWTDFDLLGDRDDRMEMLEYAMPEYQVVQLNIDSPEYRLLRPYDTYEFHCKSRAFIEKELAQDFDGKTVVISHHAPHPNSIASDFAGSALNPAFVSDLTDLISQGKPDLWIHGHVHQSFDYCISNATRIVCNPRGSGKGNPAFDWRKVVTI
ncbi:phosphatase [Paraburkholderia aspalathi]|nr:phosphatase [Paraburkholderia aspalathi]